MLKKCHLDKSHEVSFEAGPVEQIDEVFCRSNSYVMKECHVAIIDQDCIENEHIKADPVYDGFQAPTISLR